MNQESRVALVSVYHKEGIADFARQLADLGFKILASGGTAKVLSEAGIQVTDVASLVGGGPILGHRVVTLSREVHAGLLAKDSKEDREELKKLKIPFIDLVCVDLYPLEEEIENIKHKTWNLEQSRDKVIEKTDIGGPTMLRSAAKGRRIVICDPGDRTQIVDWLKAGQPEKEKTISELAAKAEFIVSQYTLASARYHSGGKFDGFLGREILSCKYGENAWQAPASLHSSSILDPLSLGNFQLVAGTVPSYNNLADVDRLLQTATHIAAGFEINFSKASPSPNLPHPTFAKDTADLRQGGGTKKGNSLPLMGRGREGWKIAVGVKHGNPCGAAVADNPSEAVRKMLEGDLRAIFGGLVMVNFEIDEQLAEILLSHKMTSGRRLFDGIVAPGFTPEAVDLLKRKGDKCRFLVNPALADLSKDSLDHQRRFRYVRGGFLRQPNYDFILDLGSADVVKLGELSESQKKDLILSWAVGFTSNSNTVTLVKGQMLIGNGVGQQDRVGGCELAIKRAKDAHHEIKGAVAYSDSFFPFVDGVQALAQAGVTAIFATSGSVRDEEIKKFCAERSLALVLLPDSQARGFFGH